MDQEVERIAEKVLRLARLRGKEYAALPLRSHGGASSFRVGELIP